MMREGIVLTGRKSFGYFAVIWSGQFISGIGSGLTAFALGVFVFRATGSAAAVSLVELLAFHCRAGRGD
jgi:hypothetical protein